MRPRSPIILFFLYVASRYSLPVSASYRFEIPSTVTVGVPIEATCIAQTPDDLNLTLFLAQARPGQENDIQGYTTNFSTRLQPDPSTGATRFVVASPGTYIIRVWANISDPALSYPTSDNSVAFAAVLASNSSTSPSTSSVPSTPSVVIPASSNSGNSNNGHVSESSSTFPNNDTPPSNSFSSSNSNTIIIAVVVTVVVAVAAALIFIFWYRARHLKKQKEGLIKVQDPFDVQDSISTLHGPQQEQWTTDAKGQRFLAVSNIRQQDLRRERNALQEEMQQINSEVRSQDGNGNETPDNMEARMREILARMDILTSEMAQMNRLMVPPSYVSDEGSEARGHGRNL